MPGFDGTGPNGQGPLTGGGRGYCAVPVPDGRGYGGGRGYARGGRGRGGRGGYGWRHQYYATGLPGWARAQQGMPVYGQGLPGREAPQGEVAALKDQAGFLKEQLEAIESRIQALESKPEPKEG